MSAQTVSAYLADIGRLAAFCDARRIARFSEVDAALVRTFAATDHARGLSARSIQRRLSALRTFYEFLVREGSSARNPALDVRAPKQKKRLPTTLDADQMGRLLAFRADDTLSSRDKAVMELFYSSGLRLTELVGLDLESLDLKDRLVRVMGKGAKSRVLPIGRYAVAALAHWLAERATLLGGAARSARRAKSSPVTDAGAVFVGRGGRRLSARAVQLRVDLWARRQGLGVARTPAHVSPLLRDAPARIQRQSARGSGAARARRHRHHPGVHPSRFPAPGEGLRCLASASPAPPRRAPQRLKRRSRAPSDGRLMHHDPERIYGTTILAVRRDGRVAVGGDGQVTLGQSVMKGNARKVRRLYGGKVLAGFAGGTADAFTLFERFEAKLEKFGNLTRAAIELAKDWRSDRSLRRLEALLCVADAEQHLCRSRATAM